MAKIVEINKCPNCAGKLEKDEDKRIMYCPSCGSEFAIEEEIEKEKNSKAKQGKTTKEKTASQKTAKKQKEIPDAFTKTEWFNYQTEYKELIKAKEAEKGMKEFVYCINELGESEKIMAYIKDNLMQVSEICCKGRNEDKMLNFAKKVRKCLDKDEKLYVYINTGIITNGKVGNLITDRRIIFSEIKTTQLKYEDIWKIAIDAKKDSFYFHFNGALNMDLSNYTDGGARQVGAVAALVCTLAFERDPKREKMILYNYADDNK